MRTHLEVIGVKEVSKLITQTEEQIREKVAQQLNRSALKIVADAKRAAPVDTGRLRASITMRSVVAKRGLELEVGTNVEYAPYVEYGTGIWAENDQGRPTPWLYYNAQYGKYLWTEGVKARPFLFPAFERERPNLVAALKRIVGE